MTKTARTRITRRTRRTTLALLAALLAIGMLAGCGTAGADGTTADAGVSATAVGTGIGAGAGSTADASSPRPMVPPEADAATEPSVSSQGFTTEPASDHGDTFEPGNDTGGNDMGPNSAGGDSSDGILAYARAMTLHEKICQMMIVIPDSITGVAGTTVVGATTRAALDKYPVGGFILFGANIENAGQVKAFNDNAQAHAKTPMFIAVDEEGGRVARLRKAFGAHSIGPMLSYESEGEHIAEQNAKTLGDTLKEHGFNLDFAPVADVWSNPQNAVIGDRAYSTSFETAARLVPAAVRGFAESGVACSLKHFPGHGDTLEDSHQGAAFIDKSLDELRSAELIPFAAGIEAGAGMVMVGHLIAPRIDESPAPFSKTLVTDVLRGELGFHGVVATDSLAMGAITQNYTVGEAAVGAVKAGVDALLSPSSVDEAISALTEATESGEIPEARIDESVVRILTLKHAIGLLELE